MSCNPFFHSPADEPATIGNGIADAVTGAKAQP